MVSGFPLPVLVVCALLALDVTHKIHALDLTDIVFVVLSQPNSYHEGRAEVFKQHLLEQTEGLGQPDVHLLHEKWTDVGAWTVLPILPDLLAESGNRAGVFFCDEETRLDLMKLLAGLRQYDLSKELFLGHALRDKEATIIHHFAFFEDPKVFAYPDFAAGFLLSMPLVQKLVEKRAANPPKMDFSIDVKHELAMYVRDDGAGTLLTDAPFLCAGNEHKDCASTYPVKLPDCGPRIGEDNVFIIVKTCEKFHTDRVPVVQKTWGKQAKHLEYASEVEDLSIPTVAVVNNNTERGHCAKFMAILKRAHTASHISRTDWLAVVDDDTLFSVPRLRKLLACYDPTEPVVLGERYGYGTSAGHGYDYITGGGGMVLSITAVRQLVGSRSCGCATDDAPDDMTLGMCLRRMGVPITHSPLFHQARPADYSDGYLSHQIPVSFHKHWMVDPYQVYKKWLQDDDLSHDEL